MKRTKDMAVSEAWQRRERMEAIVENVLRKYGWVSDSLAELKPFRLRGLEGRRTCLWFELTPTDIYREWKGRLVVNWLKGAPLVALGQEQQLPYLCHPRGKSAGRRDAAVE
jgi:hypothetical protein